jgi:RNA polymerase sigma-70 factor (ECF subfamily)
MATLRSQPPKARGARRLRSVRHACRNACCARSSASADGLEPEGIVDPPLGEHLDLDRALARLPPDVRLCIVLGYGERMSHGEISEATGMPLGTVKSHIARGAARLREMLEAYA